MKIALVIILAVIALLVLGGWITQNVATANQAAATLEVARVASASQSTVNFLIIAVAFMAVLLVIVSAVAVVMFFRVRTLAVNPPAGKWLPGPNANFGRLPSAGAGGGVDINTLLALAVVRSLLPPPAAQNPEPEKSFDQVVDGWDWYK